MFIEQVEEQLDKMSPDEMKQWILTRAKLTEEQEQQAFLQTLTGKKKVIYMPDFSEIEAFFEKAESGDIYLEYETHYYEFDEDGSYLDDWKVWYMDPFGAMSFLNEVLRGCSALVAVGEYKQAAELYEKIRNLQFDVQEAEDSEDSRADDTPFTLLHAEEEGMLSIDSKDIGTDWIKAVVKSQKCRDREEFARQVVSMLMDPLCRKLTPEILLSENISEDVFLAMEDILKAEVLNEEILLEKMYFDPKFWREKYRHEKDLARKKKLLLNIQKKCLCPKQREQPAGVSVLDASWKQIKDLIASLRYERYIDDQWQIDEVWKICEVLCKQESLPQEPWEVRQKVLMDILENDYYDYYGCGNPTGNLSKKLCVTKQEFLALADMMDNTHHRREAADLYRQYGRDDKYISYLEGNLGKESKIYIELMNYYREKEDFENAGRVAGQALEKCRDNLTEIFIYLLADAREKGEEERYKKLYASAKRRRGADIVRINRALIK